MENLIVTALVNDDLGDELNKTIAELAKEHDINGVCPHEGYTPLTAAVEREDVDLVRTVLSHGADVLKRDKYGKTARERAHEAWEYYSTAKVVGLEQNALQNRIRNLSEIMDVLDFVTARNGPNFR